MSRALSGGTTAGGSGLLHGDGPGGLAGTVERRDRVVVLGGPLRDRLGGLGAVEVDDQFIAHWQFGDGLFGLHEREGADLPFGLQDVACHSCVLSDDWCAPVVPAGAGAISDDGEGVSPGRLWWGTSCGSVAGGRVGLRCWLLVWFSHGRVPGRLVPALAHPGGGAA